MTKDNLPDLDIFLAGTVFRKFEHQIVGNIRPIYKMVIVKYPSRLEAISIDPSKIAERCIDNIYTAGQIDFCVDICKHISVSLRKKENILITKTSSRKSLILHSALLMKKALGFTDGLMIDVKNDLELKHCGLGSSSSIIQGVGAAINELFGKPMRPLEIVRYLVSNHGEEVDGDDTRLMQVQSVGGSGICGHFEGGLIINSGKATPIFRKNLPKNLTVVIGVPKNFVHYDSVTLMNKEMENMDGFKNTGSKFSEKVAYRLIHEVIPSLVNDDYKPCKDLIFDYRWDMGSIKNCSFAYPEINDIADKLRFLKDDPEVEFISLSSVGPGFFVITRNPKRIADLFSSLSMNIYFAKIFNKKYQIINKEK